MNGVMIAAEQGIIAEFIDAAALSELWNVASGQWNENTQAVEAAFPPLLHLPRQASFHAGEVNEPHRLLGTWTMGNLLDYLKAGPGCSLRLGADSAAALCTLGLDGIFPAEIPAVAVHGAGPEGRAGFAPLDRGAFDDDEDYYRKLVEWWLREMDNDKLDERSRDNALTAARFAETWRDSSTSASLGTLSAYEMEVRARRMGMVVSDSFTRSLSWTQVLIGTAAVRAFSNLVAWWGVAALMPRPFRLGLLDRCFANPGICAALLAASAAAGNLARASGQRSGSPTRFPFDGVAYACPDGDSPPGTAVVHEMIGSLQGTPVFVPIPGHPTALWEMLIPVCVGPQNPPTAFRMPEWISLRPVEPAKRAIVLRVGESRPGSDEAEGAIDVHVFSGDVTVRDLGKGRTPESSKALAVAARLWRALH